VAVQGPNGKVECRKQKAEARIQKLEAENAEVKARLKESFRLAGSTSEVGSTAKVARLIGRLTEAQVTEPPRSAGAGSGKDVE